jgi:hypothetical protein
MGDTMQKITILLNYGSNICAESDPIYLLSESDPIYLLFESDPIYLLSETI